MFSLPRRLGSFVVVSSFTLASTTALELFQPFARSVQNSTLTSNPALESALATLSGSSVQVPVSASTLPATPVVPSSSPTATSATIPISYQALNKPLGSVSISDHSPDISLMCINCTTTGTLELTADAFSINHHPGFGNGQPLIDSGYFRVVAHGMGARMEVGVSGASVTHTWKENLFTVPLTGFSLPAFGTVGISAEFTFITSIEIQESMTTTLGFDLSVPEGAYIFIDAANLSNSSSYGFQPSEGLTLTPLPFQANSTGTSFAASIGLLPKIVVGFAFLDYKVYADAGAYLDMPMLSLTATPMAHADQYCNAYNGTLNATESAIAAYLGALTMIESSVSVDVGVLAEVGNFGWSNQSSLALAQTSSVLATSCLSFDAAAKSYGVATVPASVTATSSAGAVATKGSIENATTTLGAAPTQKTPSSASDCVPGLVVSLLLLTNALVAGTI